MVGQLGKLGDETFPARILEHVGLRSKMQHPHGPARRRAQGEAQDQGRAKKAVTNVRHLEHQEVLEEGRAQSGLRAAAQSLRLPLGAA